MASVEFQGDFPYHVRAGESGSISISKHFGLWLSWNEAEAARPLSPSQVEQEDASSLTYLNVPDVKSSRQGRQAPSRTLPSQGLDLTSVRLLSHARRICAVLYHISHRRHEYDCDRRVGTSDTPGDTLGQETYVLPVIMMTTIPHFVCSC